MKCLFRMQILQIVPVLDVFSYPNLECQTTTPKQNRRQLEDHPDHPETWTRPGTWKKHHPEMKPGTQKKHTEKLHVFGSSC